MDKESRLLIFKILEIRGLFSFEDGEESGILEEGHGMGKNGIKNAYDRAL